MSIRDIEKDSTIVIAGSGGSIKKYHWRITDFIEKNNAKVLGINYMTNLCTPDYHLWTNKQRYRDLGDCIDDRSVMMFGEGISEELIRKHHRGDYITIDYIDQKGENFGYNDGVIRGHFRTAGTLAIMVAHVMGAKKIHIVGMDGYTLYSRKELEKGDKNHHCYGSGYTDDASWEKCKKKDKKVYSALRGLHEYGIDFDILTPTKFEDFYYKDILND
jgi:hypothetical protein